MSHSLPRVSDRRKTFRSLVDEFTESWVFWREACEDVRSAYERWGQCKPGQRGLAFASYRAALDREDQAARVYSMFVNRVREDRG